MLKTFVVAVSLFVVITTFPAAAQAQGTTETSVALSNVPVWILTAANQIAKQFFGPSAVLLSAQTDPEGEFLTYEFKGSAPGVLGFEVDVFPDGKLEEVEETIDLSKVPSDVTAALNSLFPGFSPTLAERSTRPSDNGLTALWYEFEGLLKGTEVDIEVNARTKAVLVEAD